jgi:hypothetical protein
MSDVPRPSPWLPVNGTAPTSGATPVVPQPAADVGSLETPATPAEHVSGPATPPAVAAPPVQRAPMLNPFGVTQSPPVAPNPSVAPNAAESWAPMRTAGIDPATAAAASASPVTLTRPAQPVVAASSRVPRPIEADEPEVIRPVAAPPAYEILPTTGGTAVVPGAFIPEAPQGSSFEPEGLAPDPVRLLGESAVTAASLDAAGARTPAAGIPMPTVPQAVPNFGIEDQFIPRFEPEPPPASPAAGLGAPQHVPYGSGAPLTGEQPRVSFMNATGLAAATHAAGLDALAPVPHAPADATGWADVAGELPSHALTQENIPVSSTPAYVPSNAGALTVAPAPPGPLTPLDPVEEGPRRGRRWLWIALAVLAGIAVGVVVYRLFFLPEPIILPAPVVTEAPPGPTIEPVAVTDENDFLAGMPTAIGTFVLTSYEVVEVIGDETLPARAADHLILTYGESTGEAHFTVNAYQFYNAEDAATAFAAWSEGATSTDDVVVAGSSVGERALVTSGGATSVVWSNGTSVFVLEGPADEVEQFYAYFGL